MFFWVVVARWCYSEVGLFFPQALPVIDQALETISLPTHDKWPELQIGDSSQMPLVAQIFQPLTEAPKKSVQPLAVAAFEKLDRQGLDNLLETLTRDQVGRAKLQKPNHVSQRKQEETSRYY